MSSIALAEHAMTVMVTTKPIPKVRLRLCIVLLPNHVVQGLIQPGRIGYALEAIRAIVLRYGKEGQDLQIQGSYSL